MEEHEAAGVGAADLSGSAHGAGRRGDGRTSAPEQVGRVEDLVVALGRVRGGRARCEAGDPDECVVVTVDAEGGCGPGAVTRSHDDFRGGTITKVPMIEMLPNDRNFGPTQK